MGFVSPGPVKEIKELHADLKEWQKSNETLSNRMYWLTIVIALLTAVMTISVGYQIYLQTR